MFLPRLGILLDCIWILLVICVDEKLNIQTLKRAKDGFAFPRAKPLPYLDGKTNVYLSIDITVDALNKYMRRSYGSK